MLWRPPRSTRTYTIFPYTTLFRAEAPRAPQFQGASVNDEDAAAVLGPGGVVGAEHSRPLLTVADGGEAGGIGAQRNQIVAHCIGPAIAEGQVVLARAALVRMAFDGQGHRWIGVQPSRSEESRVGKECVSTGRSRRAPYH